MAQCLLASPQNVFMAVVSSFAKVSMSRGTTNYILPSLPLLRSLALVLYAIHSNNLNFCYLKLEEEEIKALTSSEKPLILLRPWELNESRKHLVSSCPLSGRYLTGFCSESYNIEINNRRAGQEYLTFTNLGCVNKVNKYLQSS